MKKNMLWSENGNLGDITDAMIIRPPLHQVAKVSLMILLRVQLNSLIPSILPVLMNYILFRLYKVDGDTGASSTEDDRDQSTFIFCGLSSVTMGSGCILIVKGVTGHWIDMKAPSAWFLTMTPFCGLVVVNTLFLTSTGHAVPKYPLIATGALLCAVTSIAMTKQIRYLYRRDLVREAGIWELRRLADRRGTPQKSRMRTLQKLIHGSLPYIMATAMMAVYPLVLFPLYRLFNGSAWKTSLVFCSFLLKVGGNKLQILLLRDNKAMTVFARDICNYAYEITTCLLSRVLLVSIPDQALALQLAVLDARLETFVRAWYTGRLNSLLLESVASAETDPQRLLLECELRVMDNMNNIV